jgi:SDR family mycofactocin-dependent oxidoreductase
VSAEGPASPVALVTGAARGIGAATTRRLLGKGWRVVAADSCAGDTGDDALPYALATRADLDAVVSGHESDAVAATVDVRDRDALQQVVQDAVGRWGRLDAAVAAAAVILGGNPLWETPADDLDLLWDVDLRGVWNTAAVTVPAMLTGPDPSRCRFVAVASAAGTHGLFHLAAYNVVKHGVVGLVKGLAADLVGTGVTAVAVSPGSTRTEMLTATAAIYGLDSPSDLAGSQLVRRLIEPEELAAAITFCCSPEGAVLNGSVLHADGGFAG